MSQTQEERRDVLLDRGLAGEMNRQLAAINRAIMGNIDDLNEPGLLAMVRQLRWDVDQLQEMLQKQEAWTQRIILCALGAGLSFAGSLVLFILMWIRHP